MRLPRPHHFGEPPPCLPPHLLEFLRLSSEALRGPGSSWYTPEEGAPFSLPVGLTGSLGRTSCFLAAGQVSGSQHSRSFTRAPSGTSPCHLPLRRRPRAATWLARSATAAGAWDASRPPEPSTPSSLRPFPSCPSPPSDCATVNHFKDLAFPRGAGKYQAGVQSV